MSESICWTVVIDSTSGLVEALAKFRKEKTEGTAERIEYVVDLHNPWDYLRRLRNYFRDQVPSWWTLSVKLSAWGRVITLKLSRSLLGGYMEVWESGGRLHRPSGPARIAREFGKTTCCWYIHGDRVPRFKSILAEKTAESCLKYLREYDKAGYGVPVVSCLIQEGILHFKEVLENFQLTKNL